MQHAARGTSLPSRFANVNVGVSTWALIQFYLHALIFDVDACARASCVVCGGDVLYVLGGRHKHGPPRKIHSFRTRNTNKVDNGTHNVLCPLLRKRPTTINNKQVDREKRLESSERQSVQRLRELHSNMGAWSKEARDPTRPHLKKKDAQKQTYFYNQ